MADQQPLNRLGDFLRDGRQWYKLPRLFAMPRLIEIRNELRAKNLHDTEEPALPSARFPRPRSRAEDDRTVDGTYNDLTCPPMGAATALRPQRPARARASGHGQPVRAQPARRQPRADDARRRSSRRRSSTCSRPRGFSSWCTTGSCTSGRAPRTASTSRSRRATTGRTRTMRVPRSVPDAAPAGSTRPPAYTNPNSHWWDASQVYGCDERRSASRCARRRRQAEDRAERPAPARPGDRASTSPGSPTTGGSAWRMLHTLFALEHNYLCDQLAAQAPDLERRAALPRPRSSSTRR